MATYYQIILAILLYTYNALQYTVFNHRNTNQTFFFSNFYRELLELDLLCFLLLGGGLLECGRLLGGGLRLGGRNGERLLNRGGVLRCIGGGRRICIGGGLRRGGGSGRGFGIKTGAAVISCPSI